MIEPKCEVCLKEESQEFSFFCADCEAWVNEIACITANAEIEVLDPFEAFA